MRAYEICFRSSVRSAPSSVATVYRWDRAGPLISRTRRFQDSSATKRTDLNFVPSLIYPVPKEWCFDPSPLTKSKIAVGRCLNSWVPFPSSTV